MSTGVTFLYCTSVKGFFHYLADNLNNEISRLDTLINRFKSNNEEYLKIQQTVEDKVRSVLTGGNVLLQFALVSVIEAIRRNPDRYNNLLVTAALVSFAICVTLYCENGLR